MTAAHSLSGTTQGHAYYYQTIAQLIGLVPLRRQSIASRFMRRPGLQTAPIRTPFGTWVIVPGSPSSWTPAYSLKEPDVQLHLSRCFRRADAFIDCGANLGWYALQACSRPQIREVVAVEPVRRSVQYIELIKALNALKRLRVIEGCVTDHDGPVSFAFQEGSFSEHGYVGAQPGANNGATITGYTLETLLRQVNGTSVCLKIDVEGHELQVLASAQPETLRHKVDSVLVEVHLYKFDDPYAELRRLCKLVAPIGPPRFLLNAPVLYPGWQRLLRHTFNHYPTRQMSLDALCELILSHQLPDLFILARRPEGRS